MKTATRIILSASISIGIAALTAVSAFALGASSAMTLAGFSALALYGLLEITILSYATPTTIRRMRSANVVRKSAPALVKFPSAACCRTAA
jgi:hypothetical protein